MIDKKRKQELRAAYERACNDYAAALIGMWEISKEDTWWVSGKVGETFCFGDINAVCMDTLVYIVENDIPITQYYEWIDYCVEVDRYKLPTMNLPAFVKGAPLVSQETLDHLKECEKNLKDAIDEELKRQENSNPFQC